MWDNVGKAALGANSGKVVEKIKLEPVNTLPKFFKFSWANLALRNLGGTNFPAQDHLKLV